MRKPEEVMIVVQRGDEVLVLHRTPECGAYWHLVAGAVEADEAWADAAARELREETALGLPIVDLEREFAYALADEAEVVRARFAPEIEHVVVRCFAVEAPPGWEPTLNEEHDDYRWCSPAAAAELLYWREPRDLVLELSVP